MSEYLTEQEQVQAIKTWIKQYGFTILAGIVIALVISFGWQAYQKHLVRVSLRASLIYDQMLQARSTDDNKEAKANAEKLLANYAKTPYAEMAAFMLARDAILQKDFDGGIKQLSWVVSHANNKAIKEIASIRIARIQLAKKNPEAAIKTLNPLSNKQFAGLVNEVRGDAYLAMNNAAEAKKSYQLALKEIPNGQVSRPLLEMKYENLAAVDAG